MLFLHICIGVLILVFLYLVISDIKSVCLKNKEIERINKAIEMQIDCAEKLEEFPYDYEQEDEEWETISAKSLNNQTCLKILEVDESIETLLNYTIEECWKASENLELSAVVDYSIYKEELGNNFKQSINNLIIILKNLKYKVIPNSESDYKLTVDFSEDI